MCTSFKISAKGEAAKLWPGHLRTFTHVPGEYSLGRQVFRNNVGKYKYLLVAGHGAWIDCHLMTRTK